MSLRYHDYSEHIINNNKSIYCTILKRKINCDNQSDELIKKQKIYDSGVNINNKIKQENNIDTLVMYMSDTHDNPDDNHIEYTNNSDTLKKTKEYLIYKKDNIKKEITIDKFEINQLKMSLIYHDYSEHIINNNTKSIYSTILQINVNCENKPDEVFTKYLHIYDSDESIINNLNYSCIVIGKYCIYKDSFNTVDEWLDDNIINAYMYILSKYFNCHYLDCHCMIEWKNGMYKCDDNDECINKYIIMGVNVNNCHWIAMIADVIKDTLYYIDSKSGNHDIDLEYFK